MNSFDPIEIVRLFYQAFVELFWLLVGRTLDGAQQIGMFRGAIGVVFVCAVVFGVAHLMQRRLVRELSANPGTPVSVWMLELRYSVLGLVYYVFTLPARVIQGVTSAMGSMFARKKKDEKAGKEGAAAVQAIAPVLVASLGPSFLMAGFLTAAIYVVSLLAAPMIRLQMGAPRHFPVWQYLMYGHRPELAWYLPLGNFPYAEGVLSVVLWVGIWWWMGRFVRLYLGSDLGRNLIGEVDRGSVLPMWREWFGVTGLVVPDASYQLWAKWFPLVAIPFLLWSWLSVGGDPYRVDASLFAVTAVLWVSWGLHLRLKGFVRHGDEEVAEEVVRERV